MQYFVLLWSSECLVFVLVRYLFLLVPLVGLWCVIEAFHGHARLLLDHTYDFAQD